MIYNRYFTITISILYSVDILVFVIYIYLLYCVSWCNNYWNTYNMMPRWSPAMIWPHQRAQKYLGGKHDPVSQGLHNECRRVYRYTWYIYILIILYYIYVYIIYIYYVIDTKYKVDGIRCSDKGTQDPASHPRRMKFAQEFQRFTPREGNKNQFRHLAVWPWLHRALNGGLVAILIGISGNWGKHYLF